MSDPRVLADLAAADPLQRRAAVEALTCSPDPLDATTIAAVVACLATPMKAVQRGAAELLAQVDAAARPTVVERLRSAIGSDEVALRWGATYALGRIGLAEPTMIAPLVEALGAPDGDQRWAAADLMVTCARVHFQPVLAALLLAATDDAPDRRKMVLYVLRDVAPADPAVHAATVRGLGDSAVGVRFAALAALLRLEPRPDDACALVLDRVRLDVDPGLRRAALAALGSVGRGVSAVDAALTDAEASDDVSVRRAAGLARRRLAG
ncbi:MAG: HEAT repeat domain-containing protein [Candidatus Binatia bacterium]